MSDTYEVFHHPTDTDSPDAVDEHGEPFEDGWYYWYREEGCLPDSEPIGPFATRADAEADAEEKAAEFAAVNSEEVDDD